ncbi:MAG: hypothetical protein AB7V50_00710 [Vampirovibrionia bacterium]
MYKTVFNNASLPIILLVVAMALGIGGEFAPVPQVPVNLILLLATIPIYLVLSVILYPKGDLKAFITSTVVMLASFVISLLVASGVSIGLGKQSIAGLELLISPISLVVPLLMSVVITKMLVGLEYVSSKTSKVEEKKQPEFNKVEEQQVIQKQEMPVAIDETVIKEESIDEPVFVEPSIVEEMVEPVESIVEEKQEEPEQDVYLEDLMEDQKPVEPPKSLYDYSETEEITSEPEPEIYLEDIMQEPVKEEETFDSLGELPPLEETAVEEIKVEEVKVEEPVQPVAAKNYDNNEEKANYKMTEDFVVPRLADAPTDKNTDSGGKITSIGKLLVDHRDIENIIETNALMQSVGSDITSTKIISAVAGSKTNEKLSALSELDGIDSVVIVSDAGFIQASTLKDLYKEQVIGAMASGTFGVISTTLNKMGFQPAKDITLNSDAQSMVLNKLNDKIVTVFVNSNYSAHEFEDISQLLKASNGDDPVQLLSLLSSVNGIIGSIVASEDGKKLASKLVDESKNPDIIASMLPAFYSNLGVFIKNMDQGVMNNAIISTGNEVILFTKVDRNIIMLYTSPGTSILPNDIRIQCEAIINN